MKLEIGKEYKSTDYDFLTKLPTKETNLTYLGRHPYDSKHIFASEQGGCWFIPDSGKAFENMEKA